MNNYNYPIGSDTKDSPWNIEDPEYLSGTVDILYTLTKKGSFETNDYYKSGNKLFVEGGWERVVELYEEDHINPVTLIERMAQQLKYAKEKSDLFNEAAVNILLEEAKDWSISQYDIIDYEIYNP